MDAKKTMSKVAFIREWKGMLEFCLCLQSWFVDNGRSAIHLPTLWLSLIGLPRFATSLWQDEDASIVTENGIYFAQVAAHILTSAHDSVQLLSWLCQTSAKGIRCLMIKPISDVALAASDHWWKEEHVAKVMAQFVGSLIRDHEIPEVERKLLLALMHKAASTQEPLAMELQAQMASSK